MLSSFANSVSLALALLAFTEGVLAKPARPGAAPVVRAAAKKPTPTTHAATYVGVTTSDVYPPPGATVDTALFPPESVLGFPGPTPSMCSLSFF